MHLESIRYMRETFARHLAEPDTGRVLDVGSTGRYPRYRRIWEKRGWTYEGCDLAEGSNVDHVLEDPWIFPFENGRYDAIISGQMLEHNEFFWLTFLEMARVLRVGGLMIHIVPSRGYEHRAPQDCWRIYRDGMDAMAKWAGLTLVEATTDWAPEHLEHYSQKRGGAKHLRRTMRTEGTVWGDTIGVFRKDAEVNTGIGARYAHHFSGVFKQMDQDSKKPAKSKKSTSTK